MCCVATRKEEKAAINWSLNESAGCWECCEPWLSLSRQHMMMFCWPVSDVSVLSSSESGLASDMCVLLLSETWKYDSKALTVSVANVMTIPHFTRLGMWSLSTLSTWKLASGNGSDLSCCWHQLPGALYRHYIALHRWTCDKWTTERWSQRFSGKTSYNFEYINLSRLSKSSKKSEY